MKTQLAEPVYVSIVRCKQQERTSIALERIGVTLVVFQEETATVCCLR